MDRIRLNASEWMDFRSGEKKCFLLTNGLGGYCTLTVMGNAARNDQKTAANLYFLRNQHAKFYSTFGKNIQNRQKYWVNIRKRYKIMIY